MQSALKKYGEVSPSTGLAGAQIAQRLLDYNGLRQVQVEQVEGFLSDHHDPPCNVELKIAERQGVEIDYCPQCQGVWLDRGELDKIIDRSVAANFEDDEDDRERREHPPYAAEKRKRKSFLREMFDFD